MCIGIGRQVIKKTNKSNYMKALFEFKNEEEYIKYLKIYFTAAVLSSMGDNDAESDEIAEEAIEIAEKTLLKLGFKY